MSSLRQQREEQRKKAYKAGIDEDDMKKKREENRFSVRKQKRAEQLQKKRNIPDNDFSGAPGDAEIKLLLSRLPTIVDNELRSDNPAKRCEAVSTLRKILSIENDPPINEVIKAGAIPLLINILNLDPEVKTQFEAAWALTNVASGSSEHVGVLIRQHAVQAFVNKLSSNSDYSVKEQCVWALGNIAGDSYMCRDYILHENVLPILLRETGEHVRTGLRRNVVWTISNLCRGKPAPPFDRVSPAIPVLAELIKSPDPNIVTDACWALSYLSDGEEQKISELLRHGICETIVGLLTHQAGSVQTPALRVIGNIVTGDDFQTETAIRCGALIALKWMLDNNPKKSIKREVCWTISNITAGTVSQIEEVFKAGVIESLIQHMKYAEFDVRKEAAWAIANATSSGNPKQIQQLVDKGCLIPLCELVKAPDVRIVAVSLEGLENILERGELLRNTRVDRENPYALHIEEYNGLEHLEKLATHPNPNIYKKAKDLITKYFGLEENTEPNNAVEFSPFGSTTAIGGYSF